MMNLDPLFLPGDKVFYTGIKFKGELTSKEGKPYVGVIHAGVCNQPGTWVVEFQDTKEQDSFVMSEHVLSKYRPAKTELRHDGPEVQQRPRRKRNPDEE